MCFRRGRSIYAAISGRTDLSQNFEIPDETRTIDTNVIHLIPCMFYVEQCPVLTQIKP
jgi:hypothetical protein